MGSAALAAAVPYTGKTTEIPAVDKEVLKRDILNDTELGSFSAQELCESRGGRPGLPVPNSALKLPCSGSLTTF